jgi:hypothetical protein
VLLLVFARWLSLLLFGRLGERRMRLGPPGRRLQAVAFAVAGVVFFVDGVAEAVQAVVNHLYNAGEIDIDAEYGRWDHLADSGGSAAVQIVAGLWLFFGSKALARLWHRLRTEPNPLRPAARERTSADE